MTCLHSICRSCILLSPKRRSHWRILMTVLVRSVQVDIRAPSGVLNSDREMIQNSHYYQWRARVPETLCHRTKECAGTNIVKPGSTVLHIPRQSWTTTLSSIKSLLHHQTTAASHTWTCQRQRTSRAFGARQSSDLQAEVLPETIFIGQVVGKVHDPDTAIDISLIVNHKVREISTPGIRSSSWG